MELRDARLVDAEHLADLLHRQLVVVVEGYNEPLFSRQRVDRAGQHTLQLRFVQKQERVRVGGISRVADQQVASGFIVLRRDLVEAAQVEALDGVDQLVKIR